MLKGVKLYLQKNSTKIKNSINKFYVIKYIV